MPLTLTVINYQNRATEHPAKTIDHDVLTIGRATDNDWVLPDPEMILSRKHCVIEHRDDAYLLTDTSVNGVFLNNAEERLGKNNSVVLSDGDTLALGQYVIQASITPELGPTDLNPALEPDPNTTSPNDILTDPIKPPPEPVDNSLTNDALASANAENPAPDTIPDVVDPPVAYNNQENTTAQPPLFTPAGTMITTALPDDLTEPPSITPPEPTQSEQPNPADSSDQSGESTEKIRLAEQLAEQQQQSPPPATMMAEAAADAAAPATEQSQSEQPEPSPAPIPEPEELTPIVVESPAPAVQKESNARQEPVQADTDNPPIPPVSDFNNTDALNAFLNGAGLDDLAIAPEHIPELMHNVGALLKETATGLREVLIARSSIRNELRVADRTLVGMTMNPLKALPNVEQILHALLAQQNAGWMPAADAVREGFDDIKAHEQAMVAGIQTMLETLLIELDPQHIESQLGDASKLDVLSGGRKGKCWDAFKQRHQKLTQDSKTDSKGIFGQALAQAYEKEQRDFKP